jgi:uncharacterized membrane protein YedE/YeeE
LAYGVDGRIAGISGILGPSLKSVTQCKGVDGNVLWKCLFLVGLLAASIVAVSTNQDFSYPDAQDFSVIRYAVGGVLIGAGTRLGRGCTSGHGICGLPRFSLRSWIAVPTFMGVAVLEVGLMRHVEPFKVDEERDWKVADVQWPPKWEFPLGAAIASIVLVAVTLLVPEKIRTYVSPISCGAIFGLGLAAAGMTSQAKVFDFLDIAGTWDPSLAFVMGCGLCVSFPVLFWGQHWSSAKTWCGANFEKPPKFGNYGSLVLGAAMFGAGWGLVGICPGPAVAGIIPYAVEGSKYGWFFNVCFVMLCISWVLTDRLLEVISAKSTVEPQVESAQEAKGDEALADAPEHVITDVDKPPSIASTAATEEEP